jgi:hypothetical protein
MQCDMIEEILDISLGAKVSHNGISQTWEVGMTYNCISEIGEKRRRQNLEIHVQFLKAWAVGAGASFHTKNFRPGGFSRNCTPTRLRSIRFCLGLGLGHEVVFDANHVGQAGIERS